MSKDRKFWVKLGISYLHCAECAILPILVSDEVAVRKLYKNRTGKELNLDNPMTFTDKVNWYKLNAKNPLMQQCADKLGIREYVKSKGFEVYLNELYGVYCKASEIDIDSLPSRFVLKASHGSHMNVIVKDKTKHVWWKEKLLLDSWLHQNIYWGGREWVYRDIPRRILAEKYIEDESGELRDYKIFCFNGVPRFIQHDIGRFTKHIRNYYTTDWSLMDMTDYVGNDPSLSIPAPKSLQKMLEISRVLSEPFQFVRVDFYDVAGHPYVGEMTFFHEGGVQNFFPEKYNTIVGDMWTLVRE